MKPANGLSVKHNKNPEVLD